MCVLKIGKDIAGDFSRFSSVGNLQRAAAALSYAKEHKDVPTTSHVAWQAKNLMPLLASEATIEACVDLKGQSLPDGYMLACKLNRDPWARSTVLLMGVQLSNCRILFCGYELFPLFREQP